MAFMMPVMRNNYEIYPAKTKSRKGGSSGTNSARSSRPASRTVSESEKGNVDNSQYLTISPSRQVHVMYSASAPTPSHLRPPSQRTVRFCRSVSQDSQVAAIRRSVISRASSSSATSSNDSTNTSTTGSTTNVESSPKFGSLNKFHSKLLDSLKRKLRIKDDDVCDEDVTVIRSST